MKQIPISSAAQTISRGECHAEGSFSGSQSSSHHLLPSLYLSFSLRHGVLGQTPRSSCCAGIDAPKPVPPPVTSSSDPTPSLTAVLGSPGSGRAEGKGHCTCSGGLVDLTNSYLLQTVSFPQFCDLQAGKRLDLSPKPSGHWLHSLLDTLLVSFLSLDR